MIFRLRHLAEGSSSHTAESSSSPADRLFASGCSSPRLTTTQLPSATELWFPPTRTFTVLIRRPRGRTIDRPFGRWLSLYHMKVIIWLRRSLVLDILFPHLVRHISTRRHPIPSRPQMLAPISLPQRTVFRQELMRTLSFQVLYSLRYR